MNGEYDRFPSQELSEINLRNTFFHYTNKSNLISIFDHGLQPRIGENAVHVESTPKVFFAQGEDGILAIMDVWLKWLTAKTGKVNYYGFGTFYMKMPFCIRLIPNTVVKRKLNNPQKRQAAYIEMQNILENSIFLILNLEENIDFSYSDTDEVKQTFYKSFLKLLYTSDSDFSNTKMEYWNMHAFSNKVIESHKITLLKDDNIYNANKILINLIEKKIDYVKDHYVFLYEYYLFTKNNCYNKTKRGKNHMIQLKP